MYSKSTFVGFVTIDPSENYKTVGGNKTPFTRFNVGVSRDYAVDGKKETDFLKCHCFGKDADYLANNINKGDLILIEARPVVNKYTPEGADKPVETLEFKVEKVQLLRKKSDGNGSAGAAAPKAPAAPAAAPAADMDYDPFAEE